LEIHISTFFRLVPVMTICSSTHYTYTEVSRQSVTFSLPNTTDICNINLRIIYSLEGNLSGVAEVGG